MAGKRRSKLKVEGREIRIEDIPDFVEQKSRSLSNPVFGKLPFLEKENIGPKERRSKARNDKPGAKKLSLAIISERDFKGQEPVVPSSSLNKPASADFIKGCLFVTAPTTSLTVQISQTFPIKIVLIL